MDIFDKDVLIPEIIKLMPSKKAVLHPMVEASLSEHPSGEGMAWDEKKLRAFSEMDLIKIYQIANWKE